MAAGVFDFIRNSHHESLLLILMEAEDLFFSGGSLGYIYIRLAVRI